MDKQAQTVLDEIRRLLDHAPVCPVCGKGSVIHATARESVGKEGSVLGICTISKPCLCELSYDQISVLEVQLEPLRAAYAKLAAIMQRVEFKDGSFRPLGDRK